MLRSRLLLIDDHTLFRTGLRLVLADSPHVGDILEAGSVMEAVQLHGNTAVDIILLDIQLPGLNGLDGVQVLRNYFKPARILIVSGSSEQAALQASQINDVLGYLPKTANTAQIQEAIAHCRRGIRYFPFEADAPSLTLASAGGLTPRQLEVLGQLCLGLSNKAIALHLGLAENTVRVHVAAILDQLGVDSRLKAMLKAQQLGWVQISK
ncbi:response regulator transcription factor [Vogesella alkaliphila]|uniref:DNA-binding response regulator n=1 Tax=Vogesella alkaliphila TaxID=1193621 RepID=A0ABQ2YEG7_9NEIS|nr:response regulator transcription factor [Vogesella alkaliphila]GGX80963.1 DNA-binding response regulator [Vogesella alkaliphila]